VGKLQQPVVGVAGHRVVQAAQQHVHPGRLFQIGRDLPFGRGAQVHGVVGRHRHLVQHHLVAGGGAHAQVVPAAHGAQAGRIVRHQKLAHPRRQLVGAAPDHQPVQAVDAGGVELVAADAPALGGAHGHRGRQSAARR